MSKIIWLVVIAWVARTVWSAVKKAIDQAKAEIEADKARQQAGQQQPPPQRPTPKRPEQRNAEREAASARAPQAVTVSAQEDPKEALLRMLAAAGVSPDISKVVGKYAGKSPERAERIKTLLEAKTSAKATVFDSTDVRRIDYDDDAGENGTDYDDDAGEDGTDYDDDAYESRTDYDDDARESSLDYDDTPPPPPMVWAPPPPPVVWAPPEAPVVYAMPDDTTSAAVNAAVQADIRSHRKPEAPKRPAVHGLDAQNIHSKELVRDGVILDVLLQRYPHNPFFLRRR